MQIRKATEEDFDELKAFYFKMNYVINVRNNHYNPDNAVFPSDEMIKKAISGGGQFVGIEDGIIVIGAIVNHEAEEAYYKVKWHVPCGKDEFWVLHALRVAPEYERRGFASQMIRYLIDLAPSRNQKAIRIDVLEGYSAERLYSKFGFVYVDTVEITYEDIGSPKRFKLFERKI